MKHQSFHNLPTIEWIFNTNYPGISFCIMSGNLNVPAGINIKMLISFFLKQKCCLPDSPAFYNTGRVKLTSMIYVKETVGFAFCLFCQSENCLHFLTVFIFTDEMFVDQ